MNTISRTSLIGRALIAVMLTIGFYTLALGIAFGLLYMIYFEVVVLGAVNLRLTVFAFIIAIVILWSIIPRIDKFNPPGPRVTREKFPLLIKEIESIAQATKQEMPEDIYLVPDMNAFVAERGGFAGIGRRRVMGIGLPLFNLMTVDELSSVLAHEFGHYFGGDTALGPWIYKTRETIIRTTMNVGQANRFVYIVFEYYAKMFLRVTNAVSRQQEFTADKLAAHIVGSSATISGLQKVHKYGVAFNIFFQQEYAPVIEAGYQPPMIEGFREFLKSNKVTEAVNNSYQQQLTQGTADPYDSHPSLKERISALENLQKGVFVNDNPATSLLPINEDLETLILKQIITQKEKRDSLKSISWENVVETAFVPQWDSSTEKYKHVLSEITPQGLFEVAKNPANLFGKLAATGKLLPPNVKINQVPLNVQVQITNNVIGTAFASALRRNGWEMKNNLGEDLLFTNNERQISPYSLFPKLAAGEYTRQQWIEYCDENNISDLRFT